MSNKVCRRCGRVLDIEMFYVHKEMGDGHLNICKSCVKESARKHRELNLDRIREYDRNRKNATQRNEKNKARVMSIKISCPEKYKRQVIDAKTKNRRKDHEKCIARSRVADAIISGKIVNLGKCENCGAICRAEAHHHDYSKSLDITWLCDHCHKEEHKEIRRLKRKETL